MGSESLAHEAFQLLVDEEEIETKHISLVNARL